MPIVNAIVNVWKVVKMLSNPWSNISPKGVLFLILRACFPQILPNTKFT